jgi:hypothetical protein
LLKDEPGEETVDVIVDEPAGRHNVYAFDARLGRVRLQSVREADAEGPFEVAHIEDHEERLPVILLSRLPTFAGCVVEARVLGGVKLESAMVIIATPAADPQPRAVQGATCEGEPVVRAAVALAGTAEGPASVVEAGEAREYIAEWRREVRTAFARRAQVRAGAAWKAVAPSREGGGPHTWAENLLFTLPQRFQNYVAELLFDDERILFYVERPPFRTAGRLGLLSGRKEHEALLVLTDRMLLFMQDAIPPDITMVHWGYDANILAVEQLRSASIEPSGAYFQLAVSFESASGGHETLRFPFQESHREPVEELLPLIRSFGENAGLLPRRVYTGAPAWKNFLEPAAPVEEDGPRMTAASDRGRVVLTHGTLTVEDGSRPPALIPISDVTSFSLLRALTGCRFTVHSGEGGRIVEHSLVFNYPQAPAFLDLTARLRHRLGNAR